MLAVTPGHSEVALLLVEHGAQVDCTDKNLRTALHRAVSCTPRVTPPPLHATPLLPSPSLPFPPLPSLLSPPSPPLPSPPLPSPPLPSR